MNKRFIATLLIGGFFLSFAFATSQPFSESEFKNAIAANDTFVVAFHSPSCGSCKVQKPNLESVLNEDPLKDIKGFMADFDSTADFRKTFNKPVRGPSTILIFKSGKEVARILGETNKDKIKHIIEDAVSKN